MYISTPARAALAGTLRDVAFGQLHGNGWWSAVLSVVVPRCAVLLLLVVYVPRLGTSLTVIGSNNCGAVAPHAFFTPGAGGVVAASNMASGICGRCIPRLRLRPPTRPQTFVLAAVLGFLKHGVGCAR